MPETGDRSDTGDRNLSRRVRREERTIAVMIYMYCRAHHPRPSKPDAADLLPSPGAVTGLCQECVASLEYALRRIEKCRFGDQKPTCAQCTVHCFRPEMREQVRTVMRYSGPRMTLRHPYLAVRHLLDARASSGET